MLRLIRSNTIYAIGSVANSAALILLIPYLVNRLSVSDYGSWSLIEIGIMLFIMFALPGLEIGMMREYWDLEIEVDRLRLSGTVVIFVLAWGGMLAIVGTLVALRLADRIEFSGAPATLIGAFWAAYLETNLNVFLTIFRIRELAWRFTSISVARMILFMAGSVLFIQMGYGLFGAVLGRALSAAVTLSAAFILGHRYILWSFSWFFFRRMARYGLPLLPTRISQYILQASDRYILQTFATLTVVGIYSFGYKVASGLDILITRPFAIDWGPRRFRMATDPDAPKQYARIIIGFAGVSIFSALVLWSLVPHLYGWIAPIAYLEGLQVVPIILAAYVIYGLGYPLNIGIMLKDRTEYAAIIGGVAALLCLGLNFWWIPLYGMIGAAWATLISYLVWTAGIAIVSERLYRVPHNFWAILFLSAGAVLGYLGINWINTMGLGNGNFLMPVMIKLGYLAILFGGIGLSILKLEGIRLRRPSFISPDHST